MKAIKTHTCNVCGKLGAWDEKEWTWRHIWHGKGFNGWEEVYKMCSTKCRQWADNNIKWRVK